MKIKLFEILTNLFDHGIRVNKKEIKKIDKARNKFNSEVEKILKKRDK